MNPEIHIADDSSKAVEHLKIKVETRETKQIVTPVFDGTLSDLVNEQLPKLYRGRDDILAQILSLENLKSTIETELQKLPPREVKVEEATPVEDVPTII